MKKGFIPKKPAYLGKPAIWKYSGPRIHKELIAPVSRKANRYFELFFLLFALVLYGHTILNKPALDEKYFKDDPIALQGINAIPQILSNPDFSQQANVVSPTFDYVPIVGITFALEYQLWGNKPGLSHTVNILLFWALSVLIFFIFKRLLKNYNILFPFIVVLLFMAHPVHAEVVTSLHNRGEILAFICGLASLWFVLDYADRKKIRFLFYAMIFFLMGCLSNSSILAFLILAHLVLYFFSSLPVKEILTIFFAMFIVYTITQFGPGLLFTGYQQSNGLIENSLFLEKNIWNQLIAWLASLLFYFRILLCPYPRIDYNDFDMIQLTNLANIWILLSFLIHAGSCCYAILTFRDKNLLSFAILWYLISLAICSGFIYPPAGILNERFAFIASFGFCIAIGIFIFKIFRTDPKSLTIELDARLKIIAVVILLLIPYTLLTITRDHTSRNRFVHYSKEINSADNSVRANINYGGFLVDSP